MPNGGDDSAGGGGAARSGGNEGDGGACIAASSNGTPGIIGAKSSSSATLESIQPGPGSAQPEAPLEPLPFCPFCTSTPRVLSSSGATRPTTRAKPPETAAVAHNLPGHLAKHKGSCIDKKATSPYLAARASQSLPAGCRHRRTLRDDDDEPAASGPRTCAWLPRLPRRHSGGRPRTGRRARAAGSDRVRRVDVSTRRR